MSIIDFEDARRHIGHDIVCVCYGTHGDGPLNVSIECETCMEVLVSYDSDEVE